MRAFNEIPQFYPNYAIITRLVVSQSNLILFRGIITKYSNSYKTHKHTMWASVEFLKLAYSLRKTKQKKSSVFWSADIAQRVLVS
jgi:TRAP-type mannitol/chloroaromatic compound transport system permease small subunit